MRAGLLTVAALLFLFLASAGLVSLFTARVLEAQGTERLVLNPWPVDREELLDQLFPSLVEACLYDAYEEVVESGYFSDETDLQEFLRQRLEARLQALSPAFNSSGRLQGIQVDYFQVDHSAPEKLEWEASITFKEDSGGVSFRKTGSMDLQGFPDPRLKREYSWDLQFFYGGRLSSLTPRLVKKAEAYGETDGWAYGTFLDLLAGGLVPSQGAYVVATDDLADLPSGTLAVIFVSDNPPGSVPDLPVVWVPTDEWELVRQEIEKSEERDYAAQGSLRPRVLVVNGSIYSLAALRDAVICQKYYSGRGVSFLGRFVAGKDPWPGAATTVFLWWDGEGRPQTWAEPDFLADPSEACFVKGMPGLKTDEVAEGQVSTVGEFNVSQGLCDEIGVPDVLRWEGPP